MPPASSTAHQPESAEPPTDFAARQQAQDTEDAAIGISSEPGKPGEPSESSKPSAPSEPKEQPVEPAPFINKTSAPAPSPTQAPPNTSGKPDNDLDIPDFSEFLQLADAASREEPEKAPTPDVSDLRALLDKEPGHTQPPDLDPDDPLTRMTLMDFHDRQEFSRTPATAEQPPEDVDPLEQTIDELQSLPDRRKAPSRRKRNMQKAEDDAPVDAIDAAEEAEDLSHAEELDEPSFVRKARFRERFGPVVNWTLAIGSVLLTFALLGQGIYTFRNQLAARLPKAKPALVKACAWFGCRVTLPMQIDTISIEANELQTVGTGKDTFVLNTVLRNRSSLTQAWPNLELTLKDGSGKPLVRRVFLPREYLLDAQDVERGFAPSTEQQIKLIFNVTQPDSSGYEVAIFYP